MNTHVSLPVDEPLDAASMLGSLALHAIPGVEVTDRAAGTYRRLLPTVAGPRPVTVTITAHAVLVEVDDQGVEDAGVGAVDADRLDDTDPAAPADLLRFVRRWLDLDADLAAVRTVLGNDSVIGPLLEARPGLRIIGYPDGFEAAVMTVLGQQVSLAACRTFGGRVAEAWGSDGPGGLRLFPDPERLAALTPDELQQGIRVTGARARTVQALAEACADGLQIAPENDHTDIRRRLLALPGIGPWTADYLAVRALGDRNAFTPGDLVLRRALGGISAKDAAARAESWSPYRAYALCHLWASDPFLAALPVAERRV
ncbi:DNA-3-methyladenine glycosylase 2 [Leifsonia sp. YAF41]|uniref:DNA-3-methyladenine glycosylase 2 n=1 Tax=Leifsonia sp. YAF41 TaxID=3233086 RepID=UPI003F9A046D